MHEEPQIQIPDPVPPEGGRFSFALILAAAAVVVIGAAIYFSPGRQSPPGAAPQQAHFVFGEAEQAYAASIHVENIALSRAENFIHQEVTILNAEVVNAGAQAVQRLSVTVEFTDDMHQVVLRESRAVLGSPPAALTPGQRRSFQISFDRVPASWNMQQPTVQVSYLQLAPLK